MRTVTGWIAVKLGMSAKEEEKGEKQKEGWGRRIKRGDGGSGEGR